MPEHVRVGLYVFVFQCDLIAGETH